LFEKAFLALSKVLVDEQGKLNDDVLFFANEKIGAIK
jgi:hypothetical protein